MGCSIERDVLVVEEPEDGIVVLRLNRPGASNAVNAQMMERLEVELAGLDRRSDVRATILTGSGDRTFCAGGDFKYFSTLDSSAKVREMSSRMQGLLQRLWTSERIVIAALNGRAVGGGCEILTACHVRIADVLARFEFVQVKHGITTGWGGTARLVQILGPRKALDLLLTARELGAQEARRMGFLDRVTSAGGAVDAALEVARRASGSSRLDLSSRPADPDLSWEEAERAASAMAADDPEHRRRARAAVVSIVHRVVEAGIEAGYALETQLFSDCWDARRFWEVSSGLTR